MDRSKLGPQSVAGHAVNALLAFVAGWRLLERLLTLVSRNARRIGGAMTQPTILSGNADFLRG